MDLVAVTPPLPCKGLSATVMRISPTGEDGLPQQTLAAGEDWKCHRLWRWKADLAEEGDGLPQQAQAADDLLARQVLLAVCTAVVAVQRTAFRFQARTLCSLLQTTVRHTGGKASGDVATSQRSSASSRARSTTHSILQKSISAESACKAAS